MDRISALSDKLDQLIALLESILANPWVLPLIGLLLVTQLVFVGLTSYWGARLAKRGEHAEIRRNLDTVLRQTESVARLEEGIRSDLANSDWTLREAKTLVISKAQEVIGDIQGIIGTLRDLSLAVTNIDQQVPAEALMDDLNSSYASMKLNFPELEPLYHELHILVGNMSLKLLEIWSERRVRKEKLDPKCVQHRSGELTEINKTFTRLHLIHLNIATRCREIYLAALDAQSLTELYVRHQSAASAPEVANKAPSGLGPS
jgi:hypothetical protein